MDISETSSECSSDVDSTSEEENHMCLMVREDTEDEVSSSTNYDNLLDIFNELQEIFGELFEEHSFFNKT